MIKKISRFNKTHNSNDNPHHRRLISDTYGKIKPTWAKEKKLIETQREYFAINVVMDPSFMGPPQTAPLLPNYIFE